MRILTGVDDSFESSNAPSQGSIQANALAVFANDAAFVTDKGSAAADGDAYYDSTLDVAKVYQDGAWRKVSNYQDGALLLQNVGIDCSVDSNELTVALKKKDGSTDPDSEDPVRIAFRSTTLTDGGYRVVSWSAAASLVITNGSTLGHASGEDEDLYVYTYDDGTNKGLAVSSRVFDETVLHDLTSEGGAGGADDVDTLYADAARTSASIRLICRLKSNQTTAGTWASVPSEVHCRPILRPVVRTQVFSASGTFNKPGNIGNDGIFNVEVVGGGGGGGGTASTSGGESASAGGGGGGGYARKAIQAKDIGATETVTVGTGGSGGSAGENDGSSGATSSFGSHCSATGGGGGTGAASSSGSDVDGGGGGGGGSGGDVNVSGGDGGHGRVISALGTFSGFGGGSALGGRERCAITGAGPSGNPYGGGGGGATAGASASARAGGDGADGIVIVTWGDLK